MSHACECRFNGRGDALLLCSYHHGREVALLELTKFADHGTDPDKFRLFPWVRGYIKDFYKKHGCIANAERDFKKLSQARGPQ